MLEFEGLVVGGFKPVLNLVDKVEIGFLYVFSVGLSFAVVHALEMSHKMRVVCM